MDIFTMFVHMLTAFGTILLNIFGASSLADLHSAVFGT